MSTDTQDKIAIRKQGNPEPYVYWRVGRDVIRYRRPGELVFNSMYENQSWKLFRPLEAEKAPGEPKKQAGQQGLFG
jgi:hypothetical protein